MHQSIPAATIPPPGQCGAFVTLTCPHGRAFAATFSPGGRAFVNIGLLPPGICRSQRKDRGHELGRDKGRMRIRMRMADTDADEKIRMRKCGWGIKRGWENADGG